MPSTIAEMSLCPECERELPEGEACPTCSGNGELFRCARCSEQYAGADACPMCGRSRVALQCDEHPDAAAPDRCVVCGRALCGSCRRGEGRAALCEEHERVPVIQGWAQVYSTTREFEAQLLRQNLQAEGIDAQIFSQKDNMLTVDLGELSIVRLLVPAWDYPRAHKVIRDHMDDEGEVTFACPSCGEAYEPGSSECASCGAVLAHPTTHQ